MSDKEPDILYFANLAARRRKPASSINDKLFVLPRFPLTTHYEKNDENSFCDVNSVCESDVDLGCDCTTVMDTGSNLTVRVVISAIGLERKGSHPFHIHGHSVHILGFGYGEYSNEYGFLGVSSLDLTCTDDGNDTETIDDNRCPNPRFRSPKTFPIDRLTIRKDTLLCQLEAMWWFSSALTILGTGCSIVILCYTSERAWGSYHTRGCRQHQGSSRGDENVQLFHVGCQ